MLITFKYTISCMSNIDICVIIYDYMLSNIDLSIYICTYMNTLSSNMFMLILSYIYIYIYIYILYIIYM